MVNKSLGVRLQLRPSRWLSRYDLLVPWGKCVLPPSVVIVGYWFPLPSVRRSPRQGRANPSSPEKSTPEKTPLTLHPRGVSGVFVRLGALGEILISIQSGLFRMINIHR